MEALTLTIYPMNKHLSDYEMISRDFPFYVSLNEILHVFPMHRHDFLECSLVIEGEGYETINGERHPMSRGTFTLLLPYQVHEIVTTSPTPLRLYNCMFEMELLVQSAKKDSPHLNILRIESQQPYIQLDNVQMEPIVQIFSSMLSEYEKMHLFRNEIMLLKLHELLIQFQRKRYVRNAPDVLEPTPSARTGSVWPIIEYIHSHYREEFSLTDLSVLFGIHPSRLSVEIKKHAGINFLHLLHETRLRHACSLLAATDMSILEIALEVGFSSYKVFARVFRENKGITPGDYRKQQSAGKSNPLLIRKHVH
jgi:AraC-like DNA-binding protein/mannose-6-phosphate isomerase-like protein (cupin superfamily)